MKKRRPHSFQRRDQARQAISMWNARRHLAPVCGARRRGPDGGTCQNIPVRGQTRCRFHGGCTPKGANWHRPILGKPTGVDPTRKADKKVRELKSRQAKRAAKVAAMTPEQRERYQQWQATHRPGPPGPRALGRMYRAGGDLIRNRKPEAPRPADPEAERLAVVIAGIKAKIAAAAIVALGGEPNAPRRPPSADFPAPLYPEDDPGDQFKAILAILRDIGDVEGEAGLMAELADYQAAERAAAAGASKLARAQAPPAPAESPPSHTSADIFG